MAKREYESVGADYINLKFRCNCGNIIETGNIPIKMCSVDYDNSNSHTYEKPICDKCHKKHIVHFYDNSYYAYCEIPSLKNDEDILFLHEVPIENTGEYDTALIDYTKEMHKVKEFMDRIVKGYSVNVENSVLSRMVFSYLISIMDAYLGNTFRYRVATHEGIKQKFFQYKSRGRKVKKEKILKCLKSQSFQNIDDTVIPLYQSVLNFTIPHNDTIQDAVKIRNGIIHNYSREKDGYKYQITVDMISKLMNEIEKLVNYVNQEL